MTRQSETRQRNLFEEHEPRVELPVAQMVVQKALVAALLREIAATLASAANGESGHEQDHG